MNTITASTNVMLAVDLGKYKSVARVHPATDEVAAARSDRRSQRLIRRARKPQSGTPHSSKMLNSAPHDRQLSTPKATRARTHPVRRPWNAARAIISRN